MPLSRIRTNSATAAGLAATSYTAMREYYRKTGLASRTLGGHITLKPTGVNAHFQGTVAFSLQGSAVLEGGFTLFDEGCHPFLLIFRRNESVEQAAFEAQSFLQRGLQSAVDGLLGHQHRGARQGGDLGGRLERFIE